MTSRRTGTTMRVGVVGTGLVGTSLALAAAAAGADLLVTDTDADRLGLAVDLGAGRPARSPDELAAADLVVVATPPLRVGAVAAELLAHGSAAVITHVSSVQALPQREVEANGIGLDRFVGGHPIAGRERTGPEHADPAMFQDRPWAVCPGPAASPGATARVRQLAEACGSRPVELAPGVHDELLARLSHVPQLFASALGAALSAAGPSGAELAGPGLRDMLRIARSDPAMWQEIVVANREPIADALQAALEPLTDLCATLRDPERDAEVPGAVERLLRAGATGQALLPGKHGRRPVAAAELRVVVPDRSGALAELLGAVAAEAVNLEDLRVEHAPGQPSGVAELAVAPDARDRLAESLRAAGWSVATGATTEV